MRLSWKILMTHLLHSSCKKEKKWRGKEMQGNTKRGSIWLMKYWNIFLASGRTCQLFYKILKICRERYKVMNEFTLRNININITVLLISGAFLIYLWPLFYLRLELVIYARCEQRWNLLILLLISASHPKILITVN